MPATGEAGKPVASMNLREPSMAPHRLTLGKRAPASGKAPAPDRRPGQPPCPEAASRRVRERPAWSKRKDSMPSGPPPPRLSAPVAPAAPNTGKDTAPKKTFPEDPSP